MRTHWPLAAALLAACTLRPLSGDGGATTATTGTPSSTGAPTSGEPATSTEGMSISGTRSTTAGEGSSSAATSAEGCPFICPIDQGLDPEDCSPAHQNCTEGQKCVWFVAPGEQLRRDRARCITVTGDRKPFEPCNLPTGIGPEISDDCGADSYCLEVYGTADHGFCAPFTKAHGIYDCDDYPGTQSAVENGSDFPAACLFYECNPLDASTCPVGMTCTLYPAWLYGTNHCWFVPPGDLPIGTACDYGECGAGKLCISGEAVPGCVHDRCCTQWCDLDVPECDDPAAKCQVTFGVFPTVGACLVPGFMW